MIKEINGVTYIREKADCVLFVVEDSGEMYCCCANRPKPQGKVSFLRGGAFELINDTELKCPLLTEDDYPKREPDGYLNIGRPNRAWVCEAEEWLGLSRESNLRQRRKEREENLDE